MKKIYLASDSKARRKLLRLFGLKFRVLASRIEEKKSKGSFSYPALVKRNALQKARSVAARVKTGVIISADTIVVQDKRVFGKPKDLKEASVMLKRLSRRAQWLYTGIAVIDKEGKRELLDYEKTKVYMDKLSDSQIKGYFSLVSPLDKAGSFDIQGKGAFFIRRIEGCFYNVVGLPLRKLYLMLKKVNIGLFIVLSCVFLTGCTTEYNIATKREDIFFYSSEREVAMGRSIAREIIKKEKFASDPLLQERVEKIGRKIVAVCDRKDIDYRFFVLDDDEINAVSLPGGYVYIYRGLIEKAASDDELAGVIAHEVAHIVARHSIKKLQAMMGYSLLRVLVAHAPAGGASAGNAADIAFAEILTGYSRQDELQADQLATRYMALAGYDPAHMVSFLEKLREDARRRPLRPKAYFKTHPYVPDRIRVVKQASGGKIDFTDYINIEQRPYD